MRKTPTLSVSMIPRETGLGGFYLALHLFVLPGLLSALLPGANGAQLNFVFYLVNFLAVLGIFHSFLKDSVENAIKHHARVLLTAGLGFLGYWALSQGVRMGLTRLYPDFANVNDQSIAALSREGFLLMAVGTVLLVPLAEECLYRGLIFRGLHAQSRLLAYLLSTLAFCTIHVLGYLGAFDSKLLVLCFLQYIPAGLCLAWAYETADTIFAPVLIHTAVNALGILSLR